MKWLVITITSAIFLIYGVTLFCRAEEVRSENISSNKAKYVEFYYDDKTEYPYVFLGKVVADELLHHRARAVLKRKAVSMGADAILNYENLKGPFGFRATGIAVRWKGPHKDNY